MKSFYWNCCHITNTIARDGSISEYYDISGQPSWSASGQSTHGLLPSADGLFTVQESYTDAVGRETSNVRSVRNAAFEQSGAYAPQTTTIAYPFGTDNFRVTTDPQGICTTNITTWNSGKNITITSRARITTTTESIAGGAKITTTEWADSVSGISHKQETKTESDIQPNGCERRTSFVKYDDGDWITQSVTTSDFLGRVVATTTPLGTTSNFYDSTTGRLTRVSRTGSPDVLYFYDELGEQTETCADINSNGAVDYSGTDQITTRSTYYQKTSNEWWQVSSSAVYFQTNSTSTITTSVSRVRMTGLGVDTCNGGVLTAQSESKDWLGNITRSSTYTDAANATTWQVTDTPISTQNAFQKSIAGYPVQTISTTSVTNTFTYDGFAQQVTATDGRTNTTFTAYNDFGQVSYTQSFTNRMSYFYDDLGRRTAVSNALGQVSHTAYNSQGQTIATWGTSYPVAYQFDSAGRMIAMATTRSNTYANVNLNTFVPTGGILSSLSTQNSALDITQWIYDETTGLLTQKLYADGNGHSYTYTSSGKLHTRTWARGKTTTYTYGDLGQLTNVDYSDSTPNVIFTHDRLGRILSASSSSSVSTFRYDGLALDYETQNGYVIKRKQDVFGRDIGYELFNSVDLVNPCQIVQYSYDAFNRLSTITVTVGTETTVFTYTYLPGTDLVSGYTAITPATGTTNLVVSKSYESARNLITATTNSVGSVPFVISSFNYFNDPLGRRTRRVDYYNGSTLINDFDYNIRGEVIGADMGEDNYNCEYDPIGNRKQSTVCSGQSTVTNTYTANNLSQYTSANFAGSARNLSHDLDGNLTWDGIHWSHGWDAENRLISSAPDYWGTTNGATRIDYTYDYMNRRVSKTISIMAGRYVSYPPSYDDLQGAWSALETRRYIWDGWNIAAEIIIDQTIFATNVNYYTWGLDLSGTLQGAGGVGGLLAETKATPSSSDTYYALGDANGNVTEYIDNTGAVKAHYEYSTFGEITAQSGSMVNYFTHRFSTKPFDKKTKLIVYELRYYKAPLATWLSRDSIGEQGGDNLYGFVYNNPICLFDVLGREASGGKGGGTSSGGPNEKFDLCKCVVVQKQVVYKNTWFGKLSYDDIFPPNSKPYEKKGWKCPKAYKILITIKPKGGFGNRYQPGGDKCAVWNGETPTGGLGGGMNSLRFKPQVFFSGGNRGNAAPALWGYYFHPDEGTARETAVEYPIRSGDTSISVSINILDLTENEELGGSAYCRLEAGKSNVSTLQITY